MSTTTTNYKFIKPALTDAADITAMNQNWDAVDNALKETNNKINGVTASKIGAQSKITCGTAEPSGGSNGDVYIQIIE